MKRIALIFAVLLLAASAAGQASTVVTDTARDLTGAVVPAGQVTFELKPPAPSTISGIGTFSATTTVCTVNQAQFGTSAGQITSLVRSSNSVTATFVTSQPFIVGDVLTLGGWSDSTFNGTSAFTVTAVTTGASPTVTWAQTAANSSATGGYISALRSNPGPGSCIVTQNTALTPKGTYYKVTVWPSFSPTASFNFYALANSVDLSAVVPTPGQEPGFSFVDLFSNQTISGNKTFTGLTTLTGGILFPPLSLCVTSTFTGCFTHSNTANRVYTLPDATGIIALLGLAQSWTALQTFSVLPGFPSQAANTVLGNCTSSSAAPSACSIVSAMLPATIAANTTGNAATATALASAPTKCTTGQATIGIDASGNAQSCFTPAGATILRVTSDQSVTSTTLTNMTGMSFSASANTNYGMACQLILTQSAGGTNLAFTGPASPTALFYSVPGTNGQTAYSSLLQVNTNSAELLFEVTFTLINGSTSGTVNIQFDNTTASDTSTVKAGSFCTVQ